MKVEYDGAGLWASPAITPVEIQILENHGNGDRARANNTLVLGMQYLVLDAFEEAVSRFHFAANVSNC